jgi:hypothetical protein
MIANGQSFGMTYGPDDSGWTTLPGIFKIWLPVGEFDRFGR